MLFLSYYKPEYSIILNKCLLNILIQNIIKQNISDLLKLSNNISDTIIHWNIIIPSNINKDDLGISINNMNHIDISYINKFEESYYKDDIIIYLDIEVYYSITYLQNLVLLLKNNNIIFCEKYYIYDIPTSNLFQYTDKKVLAKKISNTPSIDNISIDNISIDNISIDNISIDNISIDNISIKFNYIYNEIDKYILYNSVYNDNIYCRNISKDVINIVMGYDILNIYINLYKININDDVIYDIVYATGGGGIKWCPYDKNLGGSEQAIVHLANEWSNNKNIYVYGNFSEELDIKADDSTYLKHYKFWYNYPFSAKVKNLIIWRKSGLYLLLKFNINADNIILDLHDNFSYTLQSMNNTDLIFCFNKITHFNFKSNYHKECFETFLQTKNIILENKKYNVIPNGIRLDEFKVANNYIRQPYRFCYCSSYDRGIANIITNIWKKIYEKQPKSELHVYYGMDYIYDNTFKINMQYLLGEKGVMDHGRQTVEYIIEEKYKSTFHIYLTDTDAEIDCINIKESLVSGCIPLLIDINVFKERDGIKFNNLAETDAIISKILSLMDNNNNELEIIRDKLKQSKTIVDWKTTSAAWNTIFLQ